MIRCCIICIDHKMAKHLAAVLTHGSPAGCFVSVCVHVCVYLCLYVYVWYQLTSERWSYSWLLELFGIEEFWHTCNPLHSVFSVSAPHAQRRTNRDGLECEQAWLKMHICGMPSGEWAQPKTVLNDSFLRHLGEMNNSPAQLFGRTQQNNSLHGG